MLLMDGQLSLRGGVSKNIARPKIRDLQPTGSCNFLQEGMEQYVIDELGLEPICTVGNPDLDPYRAWSYDFEAAYYPDDETELRFGVFYKDIETFILDGSVQSGSQVDYFGVGRTAFLRQKQNGEGAKLYGFEVSAQTPFTFLPAPFDGFGGQVNYTYSDADDVNLFNELFQQDLPFPGLSENSYNVVLYYDKGAWNGRLAYDYRSEWLVRAADRSGNPVFREAEGYLDGRLGYKFNENFSVFVEGKNLTDQEERTTAGSRVRLGDLDWYGRRYFVGGSYTF
jgi:TonB-dependent receptor